MKYKMGLSDSKPNVKRKPSGLSNGTKKLGYFGTRNMPQRGSSAGGLRKKSLLGGRFSVLGRGGVAKSQGTKGGLSRKTQFKRALGRAFVILSGVGFISFIVLAIGMGLYLKSLQESLPDPDRLVDWRSDQSTIILDRNGKELFKIYGDQNREFVAIDDYPDHAKWALLAAEDAEFYEHKGLDWKGIIRCGIISIRGYFGGGGSDSLCGASTITQQLVRNTLMFEVYGEEAYERSTFWKAARRKLRELLLSMQVERSLSKDDILQLYMNEIYLGGVYYGYGSASKGYFGKDAKELTLEESAIIAGLIQSPSRYSPQIGNPELALQRQDYVFGQLEEMTSKTGISKEDIATAREAEIRYESGAIDVEAYHWVFYVKQELEEKYGVEVVQKGGLKVTTTLDFSTQTIAEEEIRTGVANYIHKWGGYNGGMVVLDPNTGHILAMVGSVDPKEREDKRIDGSVNVTTSLQQVGSSFKPYVYFAAMQQYGPWLQTADIEYDFGSYRPQNWDGFQYYGNMLAREALVLSRNLPAVYTLQTVGLDSVIQNAEKMGITTLTNPDGYGLSMALGSAELKLTEHAAAYSVFATGGIKRDMVSILKVEDSKGEVLEEWKPSEGERIFDERDVYLMNWTMCDLGGFGDQVGGNAGYYNVDGVRGACGKTGTTDGPVDLVDVQYHKNLVVAVWAGNNDNQPMPGAWSTDTVLPIAHNFMQRMSGKYPPELYTRPAGVLEGMVCEDTGRLAPEDSNCDKVKTVYVQGRAPGEDTRKVVKVCKDTNLIPTNLTQAESLGAVVDKILLKFELENSLQNEVFQAHMLVNDSRYLFTDPESGRCALPLGPDGTPVIDLSSPDNGGNYNVGDSINIEGVVRTENGADTIEIKFDDKVIHTDKDGNDNFKYTYKIPDGTSYGNHTIIVTVKDKDNRTTSTSITLSVNIDTTNVTVKVIKPTNGSDIVALPSQLEATVTGVTANRVTFQILKPSDPAYVWSSTDLNGADGWKVNWNDLTATSGTYTFQVFAIVEGVTVIESPIVTAELVLP